MNAILKLNLTGFVNTMLGISLAQESEEIVDLRHQLLSIRDLKNFRVKKLQKHYSL